MRGNDYIYNEGFVYQDPSVTFTNISREHTSQNVEKVEADSWIKTKWRPLVAWQYVVVCLFDFIIAPVTTMFFFHSTGGDYVQWAPLTIQGGGLYHLAMGAVLGVTSWSRGQEKINRVEQNY